MECLKKGGIKTCLNVVVGEIYSEIRQELIFMACSKIRIFEVGLIIFALI